MTFSISASQLKLFNLCPRSWWLKHVARAPDDAGAGGLYLTQGNDFDRLVQLHVRDGVTGDTGAPKLANRQLYAAKRHLPEHRGAEVQFAYDIDAGGFRVRGKPDLRRRGWIQDTKTTSDRGPNRGKDKDSPSYALTDAYTPGGDIRPLSEDVQARLYAWCEFQLDSNLTNVYTQWIYVSKADCPVCWTTSANFNRADTQAWFDRVVRPSVAEMMRLVAAGLTASEVNANPDSCRRCFVRASCPGPFEGVNIYQITKKEGPNSMAFDLRKLHNRATESTAPAPVTPALETQLAASVAAAAAVAINRPPTERPAPVAPDTLNVTTIEGPAAAHAMLELVTSPEPAKRRGRPRRVDVTGATPDPLVATPSSPIAAPGCASADVGALRVAVSALIDAVRALECHGGTGVFLEAAVDALDGGVS